MDIADFNIAAISTLDKSATSQYGGKAANLGELNARGFPTPRGIALGRSVLSYFLAANGIDVETLKRLHNQGMIFLESAIAEAQEWQKRIVNTIDTSPFPASLEKVIVERLAEILDLEPRDSIVLHG